MELIDSFLIEFVCLDIQDYRAKLDVLREDNENLLKRVHITFIRLILSQ